MIEFNTIEKEFIRETFWNLSMTLKRQPKDETRDYTIALIDGILRKIGK